MKLYLYAISRRDVPLSQQAIQAAHAGIEYARLFTINSSPSYINLTARDKHELESIRARLHEAGFSTSEFHEPYKNWGLTSIACLLSEEDRHLLHGFPLWRLPTQAAA